MRLSCFQSYKLNFLKNKIKFNTRVTNIVFKDNKFEVNYQDKVNNKILKELK